LRDDGKLISMATAQEQLARPSCQLTLPMPGAQQLSGGEIWQRARAAHIRVGYLYLCTKCDKPHLNLAGGYAITADGAVATCFHVIEPKDMKEGHLVAATESGTLLPVTEILAGNRANDVAIVRVQSEKPLVPLPLNANVRPGEEAWCYSDPFGRSSYFSKGIINRFFEKKVASGAATVRMNVSTDWAPGSSGSAVVDSFGNVIGHVSEISAQGSQPTSSSPAPGANRTNQTYIIFHDAVRAADVLKLVKSSP
jgi:S1-C subfamily serine protease